GRPARDALRRLLRRVGPADAPGGAPARPARRGVAAAARLRARPRRRERRRRARGERGVSGRTYARIDLRHDEAVVVARRRAGDLAELLGFDRRDQTRVATATSELARNAYRYAHGGRVLLSRDDDALRIEVSDDGPGIPHLDDVLSGTYRSKTGMGHGLVGVHRLMDEVRIDTSAEVGTRVVIRK